MANTRPIEKFVIVRNSRTGNGEIVAQVQRFTGATAYYPDAAAAHKAASMLGGRRAGYTVESRFIDDGGRETSIRLQAVPTGPTAFAGAY